MKLGEAELELSNLRGAVVATLHGELDLSTVPPIEDRLRAELEDSPRELVVDLGPVTFLDSTATSLLFRLATESSTQRRRLVVVAPEGSIAHRLLTMVSFGEAAEIVDEFPS